MHPYLLTKDAIDAMEGESKTHMLNVILTNLENRFDVFEDVLDMVEEADFHRKLDIPKSKSIADHLWCVIGARQSYARAIQAGEWQGFECSLDSGAGPSAFKAAMNEATKAFHRTVSELPEWTDDRQALLAQLYEHEVMHEGQLIRQVYGLGLAMPDSSFWA